MTKLTAKITQRVASLFGVFSFSSNKRSNKIAWVGNAARMGMSCSRKTNNSVVCPLLENTFTMAHSPVRITKPSVRKQFAIEQSYNIPFNILNR
jgi:hypothetical protein